MMAMFNNAKQWSLREFLHGIVDLPIEQDCFINGLKLDSREVKEGDVFLACQGSQANGIAFISQAIERGAVAVLYEVHPKEGEQSIVPIESAKHKLPIVMVEDLSNRLADLATRFYGEPSKKVHMIGVTGTNGKTTCTQYIAKALSSVHRTAVIGTLGNGFLDELMDTQHTTPDVLTIHRLINEYQCAGAENVVMEVSSHGIDQGRVDGVHFDVVMFTNLTQDHLDYHGTMREYGETKQKLFRTKNLKAAIVNIDDPFGRKILKEISSDTPVVTYGFTKHEVKRPNVFYVCANSLMQSTQGMQFNIETSWGSAAVNTVLVGKFNLSNLLGVAGVLLNEGMPLDAVVNQIEQFESIAGRMQRVPTLIEGPLVVVDYAHTPDALQKALEAIAEHREESGDKKNHNHSDIWCVFGCGGDRDKSKRGQMGAIAQRLAHKVVITNDNPRSENPREIIKDILSGIRADESITVIEDRREAIRFAISHMKQNDVMLIAGKGHENYQTINGIKHSYLGDFSIAQQILIETTSGSDHS